MVLTRSDCFALCWYATLARIASTSVSDHASDQDVIGILPPQTYLELFPALFEALDAHTGKGGQDDVDAQARLQKLMEPILSFRTAQVAALGKRKLVECLGVFDTVRLASGSNHSLLDRC